MRKVLFAVVVLLAIASPVLANVEAGAAVLLNIGDEKQPVEATLVLHDDAGKVLTVNQGVVEIEDGRTMFGQVFVNGATDQRKFDIRWSTMALATEANLSSTEFDPKYGWLFDVLPEDYSQSAEAARALTIWVRAFGAKRGFIRVIFKISPKFMVGSIYTTSQLIIKVVPRSSDEQAGAASNDAIKANFSAIQNFGNATAEKVNELGQRVAKLEAWTSAAAAGSGTEKTSKHRLTIIAQRDCVLHIVDQFGKRDRTWPIKAGKTTASVVVEGGDALTYYIDNRAMKTSTDAEITEEVK